jgi:hypothetical protein
MERTLFVKDTKPQKCVTIVLKHQLGLKSVQFDSQVI